MVTGCLVNKLTIDSDSSQRAAIYSAHLLEIDISVESGRLPDMVAFARSLTIPGSILNFEILL